MEFSAKDARVLQFYKEEETYVSQKKKKQQTYWYKGFKWGFEAVRDMLGMSAYTFNKYAKKYGEHAPEYAERDIIENKVKRRAAKKFKANTTVRAMLREISQESGIPIPTLEYRYKMGKRGDDLLKSMRPKDSDSYDRNARMTRTITAYNSETGQKLVYTSVDKCAEFFGVSGGNIYHKIRTGRSIDGFTITMQKKRVCK